MKSENQIKIQCLIFPVRKKNKRCENGVYLNKITLASSKSNVSDVIFVF